jgi:hypothetical protein
LFAFLSSQACGSAEDKKKPQNKPYPGAGGDESGGQASGAGAKDSGDGGVSGSGATPGSGAASGAGNVPTGGSGGTDGGAPPNGDAGAGGSPVGPECEPGKGECDGDPDTVCERNLTLVTSCGDCETKCNSTNAAAACVEGECVLTCLNGFDDCDGNPANGCETALTGNAEHCGACDRNCAAAGATCMTNVCSVVQMQQNVSGGSDSGVMRAFAFSPHGLLNLPQNNYVLRRFPLDGVGSVTIWYPTNKAAGVEGLLVVGNDVYWSERGTSETFTGALFKKPITADADTLPTTVFIPEMAVTFLRKQGNAFYWASGSSQYDSGGFIYTRAIDAGPEDAGTQIVSVNQGISTIRQLAVTTDALYWVTSQNTGTQYELRTAPLAGSPISVVPAVFPNVSLAVTDGAALNGALNPVRLEPVGEWIYFNRDAGDAQDGIYRYKVGLERPERLVLAANVRSLQVDGDYVYFLQSNVQGVWRVPINGGQGGAAQKISASSGTSLVGVDETFLYAAAISSGTTDLFKLIK